MADMDHSSGIPIRSQPMMVRSWLNRSVSAAKVEGAGFDCMTARLFVDLDNAAHTITIAGKALKTERRRIGTLIRPPPENS